MTREELTAAWMVVCQSAEDGDFTVSRKGDKWQIKISSYMDATLAFAIMKFVATSEADSQDFDDLHPNMFE